MDGGHRTTAKAGHSKPPDTVFPLVCSGLFMAIAGAFIFSPIAALALLGAVALAAFIPRGSWLAPLLLALSAGLPVLMSERPFYIADYRFYGADLVLPVLMAAAWAVVSGRAPSWAERARIERTLLILCAIYFVWGLMSMGIGLAKGWGFNEAVGSFRRLYFYPMALPAVLLLPLGRRHLLATRYALLVALGLVILTGLWRMQTGATYRPEKYITLATIPTPRLLAYGEVMTLAGGAALAVATLISSRRWWVRGDLLAAAVLAAGLSVVSGWRLGAGYAAAVPVGAWLFMAWLRGKKLSVLLQGIIVLAAGAACIALLMSVSKEHVFLFQAQLMERIRSFAITEDVRYYAWQEAFRRFGENPVFGRGLGDELGYWTLGSEGAFYYEVSSTHNTFISTLYQSGLPGLVLLMALHALVLGATLRVRSIRADWQKTTAVGMLFLYLATLGFAMMQPLQTGSIVSMYLAMGLFRRLAAPAKQRTPAGAGSPVSG